MDFSTTDYTPAAQSALTSAQQEAQQGRAAQIEPEHVLLGLLSPAAGTVWSWLAALVRDPQALRPSAGYRIESIAAVSLRPA